MRSTSGPDRDTKSFRLIARHIEHLEQRVPNGVELFRRETREGPVDQPPVVDRAHLVDQCVRILFQRTGRPHANPEGFGVVDELRGQRDHERRRMLGIEQGLRLNDQHRTRPAWLRAPVAVLLHKPGLDHAAAMR